MKKEPSIILLMFIIPLISAVNIELSKENYQPQETLQVEITGNFIDTLKIDNILLYKDNVPRSAPAIKDLTKYQDTYYLYMILPNQEGNFSIRIENTRYTESGIEKKEEIIKSFTIERKNSSALQITPGVIKTDKDFLIKIKSLYAAQEILAYLETTGQLYNFSLPEDAEKTISFSVSEIEKKQTNLKINDYNIPVFIIEKIEAEANDSEEQNDSEIINKTIEEIEDEPKIDVANLTEEEIESLSCNDIGEKCEGAQECDGDTEVSLEGPCCIGKCIEKKEPSYKWLIGILIVIILIATLFYFYKRAKGRQKFKEHKKVLEEKSEKFRHRMGGEIFGGLGRV